MLPSLVRRTAAANIPYILTNPYRAKRLWPPDFAKISQKDQFRLEKKYRRRAKLRWARPGWVKGVKVLQLASVLLVLVYGVLFLDWNQENPENQPFQGIREWFWGLTGSVWTRDQVQKQTTGKPAAPITSVDR